MKPQDILTEKYNTDNITMSNQYITQKINNDTSFVPNISLSNGLLKNEAKNNNNNAKTVDEDYMPKDAKEYIQTFYQDLCFPEGYDTWPVQKQIDWMTIRTKKCFPDVGESLYPYFVGLFRPGDCNRSTNEKPDWLDMEKFCRGQKFACDNMGALALQSLVSLIAIFASDDSFTPLVISRQSHTPYLSYQRYIKTFVHMRNWYIENPWIKGTKAYNSMQLVRGMHLNMRRKLCKMSDDQIKEEKQIPGTMYCPMYHTIAKDFQSNVSVSPNTYDLTHILKVGKVRGLNQTDMAFTQFGFMGFAVLCPEEFGMHNVSEEDMEALCHTWRGIGYLLGAEDEFNFCRGTLEDIKQRLRDLIKYVIKPSLADIVPEWEHMSQCFVLGIYYAIPMYTFDMIILYLTRVLNINMPNLYKSMTYKNWILYNIYVFGIRQCTKLPFFVRHFNTVVQYAIDKADAFEPDTLLKVKEKSDLCLKTM